MEQHRPPSIQITLVRRNTSLHSNIPSSPTALKRKRNKIASPTKTNQEMLMETHEQLLGYVDIIDQEVQRIIHTYQAGFLQAYRKHTKSVKNELADIRRKNAQQINNDKAYIEKIDHLKRQLVIFREESYKWSEKCIKKDQDIKYLTLQLKELTHENKVLSAKLTQSVKALKRALTRQIKQQNSPSRELLKEVKELPNTTISNWTDIRFKMSSIDQKVKDKQFHTKGKHSSIDKYDIQANNTIDQPQQPVLSNLSFRQTANEFKIKTKGNFSAVKGWRQTYKNKNKVLLAEVQKIQAQKFTIQQQCLSIFKKCIEEGKKLYFKRRLQIEGLGNRTQVTMQQFKSLDYLTILHLFFSNSTILTKLHGLLFSKQHF